MTKKPKKDEPVPVELASAIQDAVFEALEPLLPKLIAWGKMCHMGHDIGDKPWKLRVSLAVVPALSLSIAEPGKTITTYTLDSRFIEELPSHQQEGLLYLQILKAVRDALPNYPEWKTGSREFDASDTTPSFT
jgi:hypothetical protein